MSATERTGLIAVLHASGVLETRVESKLADAGLSIAKLAALHVLVKRVSRSRLGTWPSGCRV